MTKINIATHLNALMAAAVRGALLDERLIDPRKYWAGARSSGRRGRSPADPAGHLSLLTGA